MVSTYVSSDNADVACPACGAAIKSSPSMRRRRVQCPKCREVITLGGPPEQHPEPAPPQKPRAAPDDTDRDHARIDTLEARVAELEQALKCLLAAGRPPATPATKLQWIPGDPQASPEGSPEQEKALLHNLSGIIAQEITIRSAAGDAAARRRAEWFKSVFERAKWAVHGPEEVSPVAGEPGMSLAVSSLPVGKAAAATYLALKAAGFAPTPVLNPALAGEQQDEAAVLSLTLASCRVA